MSLRKSPTLTPAPLDSHQCNPKKSTGSRTARARAWSRLNPLRDGWRSPECRKKEIFSCTFKAGMLLEINEGGGSSFLRSDFITENKRVTSNKPGIVLCA